MDIRTRRQKLEAMAERGTEHEAAVARTKLAEMGEEPPRDPPIANAAAMPEPEWGRYYSGPNTATVVTSSGYIHVTITVNGF